MCVYLLSMMTSKHCAIPINGGKICCTLKVVPLIHAGLLERCPIHLVYLGFGIILRLERRPPIERVINIIPTKQVLGTVTSDDPKVLDKIGKGVLSSQRQT